MEFKLNVTTETRKAMVAAIGEILATKPIYQGPPSFAFIIGDFTVRRDGTIFCADHLSENLIDKVFHTESRKTTVELRENRPQAVFYDAWVEKNGGKPARDKSTKGQGKAGAPGQRPVAAAGGKPTTSLFNKG